MSIELVATLVTAGIQTAMLALVAFMLYRIDGKLTANDAAIFLQGRRIEDALKQMREQLSK